MNHQENLNSSFEVLTQFIITYFQNKDDSLLRDAKDFFSSFIDSPRTLEKIENINQLLAVLRRKGHCTPFDRIVTRIFMKVISDDEFSKLVERHNALLNSIPGVHEPIKNIYGKL